MKRRAGGFTLIEILIVLAVAGLILAMLTQGMRIGLHGSDLYRRAVRQQSDMTPVEGALRQVIERMDPGHYPDPPVISGTAESIAFTSELPDPATGSLQTADIRLEAAAGQLVLWWTPHRYGLTFGEAPAPRRETLLDHVSRLDVAYVAKGGDGTWLSAWTKPALPALIRLRVVPLGGALVWPALMVRPLREQPEE